MVQTYRPFRFRGSKIVTLKYTHGLYVCTINCNGLYNGLYGNMYVCTINCTRLYKQTRNTICTCRGCGRWINATFYAYYRFWYAISQGTARWLLEVLACVFATMGQIGVSKNTCLVHNTLGRVHNTLDQGANKKKTVMMSNQVTPPRSKTVSPGRHAAAEALLQFSFSRNRNLDPQESWNVKSSNAARTAGCNAREGRALGLSLSLSIA